MSLFKSVYETNHEILEAISQLHCPSGFDCDMTFGNGAFWTKLDRPRLCFDITPLHDGVVQANSGALPVGDGSLDSCVFDPPFLTYVNNGRAHATTDGKTAVMSKRFGGYWAYSELEDHYKATLAEAARVLRKGGVMVFKCQDIIHNHRLHSTHTNVINWGAAVGLRLKDLFVLVAKHRMPTRAASHGRQTQRHARVHHSFFLVLENTQQK